MSDAFVMGVGVLVISFGFMCGATTLDNMWMMIPGGLTFFIGMLTVMNAIGRSYGSSDPKGEGEKDGAK